MPIVGVTYALFDVVLASADDDDGPRLGRRHTATTSAALVGKDAQTDRSWDCASPNAVRVQGRPEIASNPLRPRHPSCSHGLTLRRQPTAPAAGTFSREVPNAGPGI